MIQQTLKRCEWAETNEVFYSYHDNEWGVVSHDERYLFELLNLEGAQAGLSWLTVLKKRDHYKQVFNDFDAVKISEYDENKRADLLRDSGIIRNRLKVNAVIENAKAFLETQQEFGSFDSYIWSFSDGKTFGLQDHSFSLHVSQVMSKTLKKRGFRFIGPTICHAYMQAIGMVDDHTPDCFRYRY